MADTSSSEPRCLYEVMGVEKDCSFAEIRQAYKKLALKLHPDKLVQSGLSKEEATSKFQDLLFAYKVLSDAWMRAQYDNSIIEKKKMFENEFKPSTRRPSYIPNLSPFFSRSAFSNYSSDSNTSFFRVYSAVFNKVHTTESKFVKKIKVEAVPPEIGDLESPYAQVTSFYAYWTSFSSSMDFQWVDFFPPQYLETVTKRSERRRYQCWNERLRREARNRYNMTVRNLARVVRRRDKRVIDMAVKKEEAKKREREIIQAKKEEEIKRRIELQLSVNYCNYDDENDNNDDHKVFYCLVCRKKYKSDNQWKNHQQSKKHTHNYQLFHF